MTGVANQESLVEGEFAFTASDFRHIAQTLHAHAGIALTEGKAPLVYSRLAKRLRALGLRNFRDYCVLIEGVAGVDERQAMTAALTTNVTRFFREPHHFDHLRDAVMPELMERARRGDRIRLWSAACSSGPEPYSMAVTVLSVLPGAADLDVRILATDIDPNMVAEGARGVYSQEALEPVPPMLRQRFFKKIEADGQPRFEVEDVLRRLVSFRELNLIGDWPMKGRFDVIFCRNVVIYFDDEAQEKIWRRFVPVMSPQGVLYIGHSERVAGEAASRLRSDGLTTYRLSAA
jgi:chemotaxis protein methyltransferase CheR